MISSPVSPTSPPFWVFSITTLLHKRSKCHRAATYGADQTISTKIELDRWRLDQIGEDQTRLGKIKPDGSILRHIEPDEAYRGRSNQMEAISVKDCERTLD